MKVTERNNSLMKVEQIEKIITKEPERWIDLHWMLLTNLVAPDVIYRFIILS